MNIQSSVELNNGVRIPRFGLGVWRAEKNETRQAVLWALEAGYRHIDTASAYRNEAEVGRAVRDSGLGREEVFITTKLFNQQIREGREYEAFEESLRNLRMDYVDLYLIHWPIPGLYKRAWRVLEKIYEEGRAKAIGVSNFKVHHLNDILADCRVVPAADQMEFHPLMQDGETLALCRERNVAFESWSPLGAGGLTKDPRCAAIGEKYGKTAAQAILRWVLQKGIIVFPKSVRKERILENADIFDFELSAEDMAAFDAMNKNERVGPDPDNFNF